MKKITDQQVRDFHTLVYGHFEQHGRSLPWRNTRDPYRILVSEIMLQQTQVDRVIPKYREFLKLFPTARSLATAPLSRILKAWSGLGYNRRALSLKRCAVVLLQWHGGRVPRTLEDLDALPGIGHNSASAIMAFAYDEPVVFIETNIRSVFLHHFFPRRKKVRDKELLPFIEQALDRSHPRRWYSALMDYGSYLKKRMPNPSRRSANHALQSCFEGSNRQLRGAILRAIMASPGLPEAELSKKVGRTPGAVREALGELVSEGFVEGDAVRIRRR